MWDASGGLPLVLGDQDGLYVVGGDGLPLEQIAFGGTRRFYHHDQLGSTRMLTDATGLVTSRRDYDAYGNGAATAERMPFGFAGQYTDSQTGLMYMRARWYDPKTGQFITADPIGHASGETNLYRYAGNDPINSLDPSGLFDVTPEFIDRAAGDVRDAASATVRGAGDIAEWTWQNRQSVLTVVGGVVCVAASAGTCLVVAAGALSAVTADNVIQEITGPACDFAFWHNQFGDTFATVVGAVPAVRLLNGVETLLPASRLGRYGVNTMLTWPGVTTGLVYK